MYLQPRFYLGSEMEFYKLIFINYTIFAETFISDLKYYLGPELISAYESKNNDSGSQSSGEQVQGLQGNFSIQGVYMY